MVSITELLSNTKGQINPDVILRKGIYDKVAATIILQKFIDFYQNENQNFIGEEIKEKISG